jgi:hypothetical protein
MKPSEQQLFVSFFDSFLLVLLLDHEDRGSRFAETSVNKEYVALNTKRQYSLASDSALPIAKSKSLCAKTQLAKSRLRWIDIETDRSRIQSYKRL